VAEAAPGRAGALRALPPGARLDLHMHSDRSDGRLTPGEVLRACADGGLHAVALTDHDLAPALPAGRHTVGLRTLHMIHGAEMSGHHRGVELHLLVYFPGEMPADYRTFCAERARARADRYAGAAQRLGLPGVPPPDEAARSGERALTRFHLSQALVDAGHAPDVNAAFARYTGSAHGLVPLIDISAVDVIASARAAGGVVSWAHPELARAREWAAELTSAGLQGLEGLRPGLSTRDRNGFRRLARRLGLFLTGGSDYHGWRPGRLGDFGVPRRELGGFLDALAAA
jgi:predicted metal-dependent phosphoesterase TrpH